MPWLHKGHVIPTLCQWSRDPNIESFFASKQISNIFHSKILYTLFLVSNLPCTNLDTTFHISTLVFSRAKVLRVL